MKFPLHIVLLVFCFVSSTGFGQTAICSVTIKCSSGAVASCRSFPTGEYSLCNENPEKKYVNCGGARICCSEDGYALVFRNISHPSSGTLIQLEKCANTGTKL